MLRQKHNPTPITPTTQYKLDDGQTSISNYFPARPLKKAISTDNFWQTRVITNAELNGNEGEEYENSFEMNNMVQSRLDGHHGLDGLDTRNSSKSPGVTTTPEKSPRDGAQRFRDQILHTDESGTHKVKTHTLNDTFILKITSAENHENVISLNISGFKFNSVDKSNFKRFNSCAFVQASRTRNSVNLDSFEDLGGLSDLELNMSEISFLSGMEVKVVYFWRVIFFGQNQSK